MNEKLRDYLNSIYQNSSTAKQSIHDLMESVVNESLKKELENQYKGYDNISKECEKFAIDNDVEIKDNNWFEKAKMWTSVKMSTLTDNSTRHLAELLLLGTIMGLNICYKDRWDYKNVNKNLDEILNKLEVLEEENYKSLKHFLKGDIDKEVKCRKDCNDKKDKELKKICECNDCNCENNKK